MIHDQSSQVGTKLLAMRATIVMMSRPREASRIEPRGRKDGIIMQAENGSSPMTVRWALTEKGEDALQIHMRLMAIGSKW